MHANQNPGRVPWRNLITGIVTLVALVAAGAYVFVYAEIGGVRGTTIPLHVSFREARDIMPNSEVWLHGERVGIVKSIEFQAPGGGQSRVMMSLEILDRVRPFIRRDATVQVRRGESFLGARVLYIAGGTPGSPSVASGDTLGATVWMDQDQLAGNIRSGVADTRAVMSNVRLTARAIRDAQGSIAALMGTDGSTEPSEIQNVLESWSLLNERTQALRSITGDTALRFRITGVMTRLETLEDASQSGSVRLTLADSALRGSAGALAAELAVVRQALRERMQLARGAVGADSSATADTSTGSADLAQFDSALGLLIQDLKRRPWRYVAF